MEPDTVRTQPNIVMPLVILSVLLFALSLLFKVFNDGIAIDYFIMVSGGFFLGVSALYDQSKGESFGRFIEANRQKNPELFWLIVIIRYVAGAFGIAFGLFKLLQHI